MATLNYIRETRQSASAMKRVIDYCTQDYKVTDPDSGRRYVSGIGCDGENSYTEFMATKKCFGKASGVFFYQYEQSFSPDEKITPETAHTVALEFAERAWQGHEVLVTTHVDRHHLHTHFVINSVSYRDGSKLRQSPKTLEKLRALNDEICQAHGLSVLEPYTGGGMHISAREYRAAMKAETGSPRSLLRGERRNRHTRSRHTNRICLPSTANDDAASINHAMERSGNREDFIREMEGLGYQVRWTAERKYITYMCPNGMKCRDIKLHEEKYRKEMMEREFQYRTDKQNGRRFDHEEFGTSGKDRDGAGAEDRDDALRPQTRGDRALADSGTVPADAVYADQTAGNAEGYGTVFESDRRDGRRVYEEDGEQLLGESSGDDERGLGAVATGWEASREVYFELHTGASNGTGQADGSAGQSQETDATAPDRNLDHGDRALGAGILSGLPRSGIIDDDNEDEEERRKRIQAEQNGADLGALIGLTAGLVTEILSSDSDKNNNAESDEGDTEGEYPAEDESFTIAHNM
ncbi:relaxase/mobilization nuclease domain-containing protein [Ruminococcus sp.]|uniref:relaxase/mobilization nuclease domain-containing protein n=1 Tax=Ruminococcus sp. TaxID=41978 RepID=UPI002E819C17|nr:relaxase/mobilization nuclease domain-containing protein [Ruminococcus sp.]MEE3491457.1 relaxase/mobilization nuclease domain-containing protein [Ruminococcus sp.]